MEVAPISLMFLGNVVFGLGSTKSLNLPMFTALRRFSIFMTMCGEYFVLKKTPSISVVVSVLLMVGGALIAGVYIKYHPILYNYLNINYFSIL